MGIDMVKLVSFGADAGRLMEELLEHAGIGEVGPGTVKVQPEADGAVMELLRKADDGGWIIRVLDKPGAVDGPGDDIRITQLDADWLRGVEVDKNGRTTGTLVGWVWRTIGQLHIY
jgi:hypothetical protein